MEIYQGIVWAFGLVVLSLFLSASVRKTWMRLLISSVLFLAICGTATFGMGGLRPQIEAARHAGKSEAFISGMAHRNHALNSPRLEILLYGLGLFSLAIAGWLPKREK